MLILARKAGEGIQIGPSITVRVLEIRGKQVRLGIEAPPETAVHRTEVYQRICAQNRQAAEAPADLMEILRAWQQRKGDRSADTR